MHNSVTGYDNGKAYTIGLGGLNSLAKRIHRAKKSAFCIS
jgi:hypothetical protein